MQLTAITTKGQVTIPKKIRERLGLEPGDKVVFEDDMETVRLKAVPDFFSFKGALRARRSYDEKKVYEKIGKHLAKKYLKTLKNL